VTALRPSKQKIKKAREYVLFLCNTAVAPYARSILPERRHRVQTYSRLGVPSTKILIFCRLGFHILLLCLFECETVLPETTLFLHTKHSLAML
jgi:hypothetical protein